MPINAGLIFVISKFFSLTCRGKLVFHEAKNLKHASNSYFQDGRYDSRIDLPEFHLGTSTNYVENNSGELMLK